ncbi:MAG TPA: HlyD family secretion protein [Caulifigura sp.]|nr:HlyD family secretion protein [Caulifigura sp.]
MALVPLAVAAGGWWYWKSLAFVSTDDAYVNGHVTFVAPRVSGQVAKVLVDDNNRVRKGDLLVQLDKEPFLVAQRIASAAVDAAKADVIAALATTRATAAEVRTMRFALDHAIEDVNNQVALLKSRIASLESMKATEARARSDFDRTDKLAKSNATTQQQVDATQEALKVSVAHVAEALEQIHQVRVGLGLPATPPDGKGLDDVPADLNQTFSAVRQAQGALLQSAAKLGAVDSLSKSPKQMIADFYQRDPSGDVDKILEHLVENAPAVKQAQSRLLQAERSLAQADLNLKYTDVVAEIDGVVTRRNVNPGNNVVAGQALMAVRSLTEIWVDANFKETQIRELRIGQRVDLDVDMYGRHQTFEGRISGFTMGTGSTLALLPAQNATGNFVKVVQRLPVRIDILDYDPDRAPLFIGLSVEPRVFLHEPPQGPNAGKVLQPALVVGDAQR